MREDYLLMLLSWRGQISTQRNDPGSLDICVTQHCPLGMVSAVPACLILAVISAVSWNHCLGLGCSPSSS